MPDTALIVSSGRTGTQFLARYFDANFDGVVGRHEPKPRVSVRLLANAWAAGAVPRGLAVAALRRRARRLAPRDARLYVESNPFLWGLVDLFDEAFDRPTIVHVVRDPREQVRSALSHGIGAGRKAVANRLVPFWYPDVRAVAGVGRRPDWLARAAGLWTLVNGRLRAAGARCAAYHVIRYEDLFDERHSGLDALCALLGLEPPGAAAPVDPSVRLNRGERDVLGRWEDWTDAQCAAVHAICGALMRAYDYGDEPAWRARVAAAAPGAAAGARA